MSVLVGEGTLISVCAAFRQARCWCWLSSAESALHLSQTHGEVYNVLGLELLSVCLLVLVVFSVLVVLLSPSVLLRFAVLLVERTVRVCLS